MLLDSACGLDTLTPRWLDTVLDALEYTKLGRVDMNTAGKATFSFVHRRFQEYFATCVVIRERRRVPVTSLLDNDQWRETAVSLLQIQEQHDTAPLINEALSRLSAYTRQVEAEEFHWPDGCLHLLSILSTGLESRVDTVSELLREYVDRIIIRAWEAGSRLDKRRALNFVLLASPTVAEKLLTEAFRSRNELLREGAFRSAGFLPSLSPQLRAQIRTALLGLAASTDLYRKRASTVAQIKRLAQSSDFLALLTLLSIAQPIAIVFSIGGFLALSASVIFDLGPTSTQAVGGYIASIIFVMVAVLIISTMFSQAALRRGGGRLNDSMSRSTLIEYRVLRGCAIAVALAVHTAFCFISVGYLLFKTAAGSLATVAAITAYGGLWPAAVIWSVKNGAGSRIAWWPLLPAVMLVLGGSRLPNWLRQRYSELIKWGGRAACLQLLTTIGLMLRPSWRKIGYVLAALLIVATASISLLLLAKYVPLAALILMALSSASFLLIRFLMSSYPLRTATTNARTGEDTLALVARLRSPSAFDTVIARLGTQRIAREPDAKQAIENLVGEIERAQIRATEERNLSLRQACPSLADQQVPTHWLLDCRLLRPWTLLRTVEVREDTLDELARLSDKD
ncbi:hypothetical protein LX88_006250 [Lentzea californiensis]|nr:hypothetical protein [Lentzea californiensis]